MADSTKTKSGSVIFLMLLLVVISGTVAALYMSGFLGSGGKGTENPSLEIDEKGERIRLNDLDPVIVSGLKKTAPTATALKRFLSVFTMEGEKVVNQDLPLLGVFRFEERALVFLPRFPLVRGVPYRVKADLGALYREFGPTGEKPPAAILFHDHWVERDFPSAPTRVTAVYPSENHLPMNLLKFYICFSAAMTRGDSYNHINLYGEDGAPLQQVFLELEEELWDPFSRRLTLLLDPGRIKSGLRSHQDLGDALQPGGRYTLEINGTWPDAQGRPLAGPFRKTFMVTDPVRRRIDHSRWTTTPPQVGTRASLSLDFAEPMDFGLLNRVIQVLDPEGREVTGEIHIRDAERRWLFTPASAWDSGTHALVVAAILEDVAGNNLNRAFEAASGFRPLQDPSRTLHLPFSPR